MKIGTKSLVYGVHQIFWHPFTVFLAWLELYGWPSWKEAVCIFIHDLGYYGCSSMEGEEGQDHPRWAAVFASMHLDNKGGVQYPWERYYSGLCLLHSRTFAHKLGVSPSKLCWADKRSIIYERWWTYLPRAYLSGELAEYKGMAIKAGLVPPDISNIAWFKWAQERMIRKANTQDAIPPYAGANYVNLR